MRFETETVCESCITPITVFPAYDTVSKCSQRSLPGWKRCECRPRLQEITTAEFDALVPGWHEIMNPGNPEEKLED
jgi:hypothetical protein